MQRWIATILLIVVLAPSFGPMALASAAQPDAVHCLRKPLQGAQPAPAIQCHHGSEAATRLSASETRGTSFSSLDSCCANHDCCRGLKTSEWAWPAVALPAFSNLAIQTACVRQPSITISVYARRPGFARAPPQV